MFSIMNIARCIIILDLKLFYKARVTTTAMYKYKAHMTNNGPE